MHAFLTGASGFLGGRLAQILAERGETVTALIRRGSETRHLDSLRVRIVRGSLTDAEALREALPGATHIFHCAAASTDWAPESTYRESNVRGTETLLAAALAHAPALERFLHVSTTDVYGYPRVPCAEDGPLVDAGLPYNRTKKLAEEAVWHAAVEAGLPVTVVRPATIYGPRGKAFVTDIAELLRARQMAVVAGGRERGGFLYVDDAVNGMLLAATLPAALGQAYNLCDGAGGTWREYVDGLADALGYKHAWIDLPYGFAGLTAKIMETPWRLLPRLPGRPLLTQHAVVLLGRDQEFPIARAQAELGFTPRVFLAEGLGRSADWFKSRDS